jgi:hypothetical protein
MKTQTATAAQIPKAISTDNAPYFFSQVLMYEEQLLNAFEQGEESDGGKDLGDSRGRAGGALGAGNRWKDRIKRS